MGTRRIPPITPNVVGMVVTLGFLVGISAWVVGFAARVEPWMLVPAIPTLVLVAGISARIAYEWWAER